MLEVDIKELLGAPALSEQKSDEVVEQLARINEQLVVLAAFLFGINTSSSSMEEESVVEIEAEYEE